jgi:iron complex outermembrane receptor protein
MVRLGIGLIAACAFMTSAVADDDGTKRRIEEVVVTAEKVESTVSDTSISITALGSELIEDLGIQSADEFVNFIPATTRDSYDIRIRGVGRNFRSLGGDPGVATYYNGVYSEDALIALTENALFDVERIEVLRGPQGTLYGRNSVGGAINYITKGPSEELSGLVRVQVGSERNRELYGVVSGPLKVENGSAGYRLTVSDRNRDGWMKGQYGSPDTDSTNDQNVSLTMAFAPNDRWDVSMRLNKRNSYRVIGNGVIIDENWGTARGSRRTDLYAYGMRVATADTAGATMFTHPTSGVVAYGAPIRPGVDVAASNVVNHAFGSNAYLNGDGDLERAQPEALTNGLTDEGFDQQGASLNVAFELNDAMTLKYIFGYGDFDYTYTLDTDYSNSEISNSGNRVLEDVWNASHEVQLLWDVTDDFFLTSGLYYFASDRKQDWTVSHYNSQGKIDQAADYGNLAPIMAAFGLTDYTKIADAPMGFQTSGLWTGDADGNAYNHINTNYVVQTAIFSQGVYTFNDEFALTVGVRYAEDEKEVLERRGGYFESLFPFDFGIRPGLLAAFGVDEATATALGWSNLALANVAMGNALPTLDPTGENPLTPTCAFTATTCATPMRLEGIPFGFSSLATETKKWSKATGRINLDWTPNDDTLVYLSYTTGYRAGGYGLGTLDARSISGGVVQSVYSYDEEEVAHTELGFKGTFLDGTLQIFSSIYNYQYDGYQDAVEVYDEVQATFRDIPTNTGNAINQGWEVEGTWLATDELTINANYSLTKTEYQDDVYLLEDDNPLIPEPLFGDTSHNLKGSSLKGIPEHKFTAWANYRFELENGRLVAAAYYSFTGEYNSNSIDRDLDKMPARHQTDASLIWSNPDESLRIRAFVDNLFDARNYRSLSAGSLSNNYRLTGTLLRPRSFGIDITKTFGEG